MNVDQKKQLAEDPPADALGHREQGGKTLTYIEGWWAIDQMDAIFSPDGWSRCFTGKGLYEVSRFEHMVKGRDGIERMRYDIGMLCEYRTTAGGAVAEDVGFGIGQSYHGYADAFESAAKEAVTDALKRCLRSLGRRFGNSLYDKKDPSHNQNGNQGNHAPQDAGGF